MDELAAILRARDITLPEVERLLQLDIPVHLGTLDKEGFPRITPLWFLYEAGTIYMSSLVGKRHLRDLERDPRASLCIDTEDHQTIEGVRPNRQITMRGHAQLMADVHGLWTCKISLKYVPGPAGERLARQRAAAPRQVIALRPERIYAVGTG